MIPRILRMILTNQVPTDGYDKICRTVSGARFSAATRIAHEYSMDDPSGAGGAEAADPSSSFNSNRRRLRWPSRSTGNRRGVDRTREHLFYYTLGHVMSGYDAGRLDRAS